VKQQFLPCLETAFVPASMGKWHCAAHESHCQELLKILKFFNCQHAIQSYSLFQQEFFVFLMLCKNRLHENFNKANFSSTKANPWWWNRIRASSCECFCGAEVCLQPAGETYSVLGHSLHQHEAF